jgi:hypothetical protein
MARVKQTGILYKGITAKPRGNEPDVTKRLRQQTIVSQAPDVTVTVGSGRDAVKFKCWSVILASSSPMLDAMLSNGMAESESKEIKFSNKDPNEFRTLLECIDPASAVLFSKKSDEDEHEPYDDCVLNRWNAHTLAPWFNELQMQPYLAKCDEILLTKIDVSDHGARRLQFDHDCIQKLVSDLSFAIRYNLKITRDRIEEILNIFLERFLWGFGRIDCFRLETIQELLECIAPFQAINEEENASGSQPPTKKQKKLLFSVESSNCASIWNQICSCLDFDLLSTEMINDIHGFSHIVYYSSQSYHKEMMLQRSTIVQTLKGKDGPCYLQIGKSSSSRTKIDEYGGSFLIDKAVASMPFPTLAKTECYKRKYILSEDKELVSLVWTPSYVQSARSCLATNPELGSIRLKEADITVTTGSDASKKEFRCQKTISARSCLATDPELGSIRLKEAEITVTAGSDASRKEFRCQKTIMSFASTKLDALIAESSNGTLLLPDVNPDSWDLFYKSIDPRQSDKSKDENTKRPLLEKAKLLAPLFCKFDMINYLDSCEDIFRNFIKDQENVWDICCDDPDINEAVTLLRLSMTCNLAGTKKEAESLIKWLFQFEPEYLPDNVRNMGVHTVMDIISLCLPIERATADDAFQSLSCPVLFEGLNSFIGNHLKSLMTNKVEENECILFAHLVHSYIQCEARASDDRDY